ncbi:MAG: GntR family transcriptional regulator [Armatimonadetes bacterium]|nr:GntR family transcriptional regulator [Armatimonadota bacterium]
MAFLTCADEMAYNQIKQRILEGRLVPGTRLVHRTLAKEIGISRAPLAQALRMLERDGLVINTPGLGACVRSWSREELIDLYNVRAFLEALAARLCAQRATTTELERIVAADQAVKRTVDANDVEANAAAEIEFHKAIMIGAHNWDLERITDNLAAMEYSTKMLCINLGIPRILSQEFRSVHDKLVEAILSRDPDAAEKAAKEHVEQSIEPYLAWMDRLGAEMLRGRHVRPLAPSVEAAPAATKK